MEEKIPLADQIYRHEARQNLVESFCLEAAAGTGKTTLLVERILALIQQKKAKLEEIVAITFTEKAAGELKMRLREGLEKALGEAAAEEKHIFGSALHDLEKANISTIHSFCATLLRERPVEAGVDPNFQPLDEIGMDLLFQEVWENWLRQEMEQKAPPLKRALILGLELKEITQLVRQIYENRDLLPEGCYPRPEYALTDFLPDLEKGISQAKALAEAHCRKEEDLGFQNIQNLWKKIPDLSVLPTDLKEAYILQELEIKVQGNKQNWQPPEICTQQKEILDSLAKRLKKLKENIRAHALAELIDWVKGFLRTIQEEKEKQGVLDFQDLLILARNLLRHNKEVRRYFQDRFLFILVDEFQDTDPLQVEVVFFLAEKGAKAERWTEVEIAPGKLFLVGDPKQSIYRFRRADIEVYDQAAKNLQKKGQALKVNQNFRTVPSIISWTNRIFENLIQPGPEGFYQPPYIPMVPYPGRKEVIKDQPGVILLYPPADFNLEEAHLSEIREKEALAISWLIKKMVAEDNPKPWLVYDKEKEGIRRVNYKDIALLFPAYSGIEIYEEALKSLAIPYRLEGGKEFFLRQEVRSLCCCLKAVDDPADEISLFAALRSPFFGFSDETLFLFLSSGNQLNYLRTPQDKNSPLADAFKLLRNLHEERNAHAISWVVEKLLSATKAWEFSLLRPGGEQTAANLRKILEQARIFDGEEKANFRRFIQWLESKEEGVREEESPWAEERDEQVRLLTIHRSKGLEFPIVILANLASGRRHNQAFIPERATGSFQLASGSFKTIGYEDALQKERLRMEAEDRRLLYVAVTRARDHLVVPLFSGKKHKGFLSLLQDMLPSLSEIHSSSIIGEQLIWQMNDVDQRLIESTPWRLPMEETASREAEEILHQRQKWQEKIKSAIAKAARGPTMIAPSAAASLGRTSPEGFLAQMGEDEEKGATFGLAFHEVMENVDWPEGRNLRELCLLKAKEYGITDRVEELVSLSAKCLAHPLGERIRRAQRIFREVPFAVILDEKIVEGKIDLLLAENNDWVIIDFKTDKIEKEALASRVTLYREQGVYYARAMQQITGQKVKEVIFFFVRLGELATLTDWA